MEFQSGPLLPRNDTAIAAALAQHASEHSGAREPLTLLDKPEGRTRKDGVTITRYQCPHAKSHECALVVRVVQADDWARVEKHGAWGAPARRACGASIWPFRQLAAPPRGIQLQSTRSRAPVTKTPQPWCSTSAVPARTARRPRNSVPQNGRFEAPTTHL